MQSIGRNKLPAIVGCKYSFREREWEIEILAGDKYCYTDLPSTHFLLKARDFHMFEAKIKYPFKHYYDLLR